MKKTEAEWKKELGPEAYKVLREKGTEPPFSGEYYYKNEAGNYCCAACGEPLFGSETKFDAGCGWPSFYSPLKKEKIATEIDQRYGMIRTEVKCANCGSHLGHVFNDGPVPTGERYCINSIALNFKDKKTE